MKHTKLLSRLICGLLLCNAIVAHAIIPASISNGYTVSSPDHSTGAVTIQNGGTLTITGTSAVATINGSHHHHVRRQAVHPEWRYRKNGGRH